ncbi:MAG: hypothetical protein IJQ67_05560 [Bacilli bacterium]|nr:hypothetical protein [Bacilli bacterium]
MAGYVYFDVNGKTGRRGISSHVFDQLVTIALTNLKDVSVSSRQMKRNQKIRLNRPVQTTIRHGIVHIWVNVDIKKNMNIQDTCQLIQEEIANTLMTSAEQVPFDVQVKVDQIIA